MLIAFNKPFGVLSQFTARESSHRTLAEFSFPPNVYPIGRLDWDSEGLLLLTDEKELIAGFLEPRFAHPRTYWVQVEGIPSTDALKQLSSGVEIQGKRTLPCKASILHPQPQIADRTPPIRFRKNIPTYWISIELVEGRNRQVRRMTACMGHPTLRLIRVEIGRFQANQIL